MLDTIADIRNTAHLLRAITIGRPTMHYGEFDVTEVSFRQLEESLKASRFYSSICSRLLELPNKYALSNTFSKVPNVGTSFSYTNWAAAQVEGFSGTEAHKRSNKLEKLIFYAEVCVNLRKAVLSRLTAEEFTAMNDVRARLDDWEKVNKIFDRQDDAAVTVDGSTPEKSRSRAASSSSIIIGTPPTLSRSSSVDTLDAQVVAEYNQVRVEIYDSMICDMGKAYLIWVFDTQYILHINKKTSLIN